MNRVFKATGYKIGLLANFTHPKTEIKRFLLLQALIQALPVCVCVSLRQMEARYCLEIKKVPFDNVHIFVCLVIMKTISFYRTASGKCPVEEHLDNLTDAQTTKIAWVLKLIRELDQIPTKYFKKLVKTDDIWEARVDVGKNTFRLLGFFYDRGLIILTNSFPKKAGRPL